MFVCVSVCCVVSVCVKPSVCAHVCIGVSLSVCFFVVGGCVFVCVCAHLSVFRVCVVIVVVWLCGCVGV